MTAMGSFGTQKQAWQAHGRDIIFRYAASTLSVYTCRCPAAAQQLPSVVLATSVSAKGNRHGKTTSHQASEF